MARVLDNLPTDRLIIETVLRFDDDDISDPPPEQCQRVEAFVQPPLTYETGENNRWQEHPVLHGGGSAASSIPPPTTTTFIRAASVPTEQPPTPPPPPRAAAPVPVIGLVGVTDKVATPAYW